MIMHIISEVMKRDYMLDYEIDLSYNYHSVYNGKKVKDINVSDILDEVVDDINGYNITFSLLVDIENHGANWKRVNISFWSGKDENNNIGLDSSKYGKFEWSTSGNRESISGNGLTPILSRKNNEDSNYFSYGNVGKVLDNLNALDILLDKQKQEKEDIYNNIRMRLPS